jgi:2'-5' RNA ligase
MEVKRIQENLPEFTGNKTKLSNLHLTLKFLGEIPFEKVEKIKEILKNINFNKFEAEIKEIGFFDKLNSGIIWLGLTNCEKIQKEIDEVLALNGLYEKEKRFMSHLTIARTKKIKDKKIFLENLNKINIPKMFFIVDNFYLMQSKLKKEGPEYSALEEYSLK